MFWSFMPRLIAAVTLKKKLENSFPFFSWKFNGTKKNFNNEEERKILSWRLFFLPFSRGVRYSYWNPIISWFVSHSAFFGRSILYQGFFHSRGSNMRLLIKKEIIPSAAWHPLMVVKKTYIRLTFNLSFIFFHIQRLKIKIFRNIRIKIHMGLWHVENDFPSHVREVVLHFFKRKM